MMAHPLALQLRNLQSLVEIAVDKNSTVVFPAPLMSTIGELGSFLSREATAAAAPAPHPRPDTPDTPDTQLATKSVHLPAPGPVHVPAPNGATGTP